MALHNREICKVGESPSRMRRCSSPCRMTTTFVEGVAESGDFAQASTIIIEPESPKSPKSPKLSPRNTPSPSSASTPTAPDAPAGKVSSRLLMQKSDRAESVVSKGSKSPKHAAWKTSKFFGRSMASGELLKGFKKLSTTAAPTITGATEDAAQAADSNKSSDSKSFKNRFSSLRRKSGSDTDKVPVVDEETLKHGSSDVKGIICKKEDIMSLINEVSKERRVSSPGELTIPPSLPTQAVPVLKSPSLKIPPGSPLNRGNFRSSRSSSLDPTMIPNERLLYRPQAKLPMIRTVVHPPSMTSGHRVSDDIYIQKKSFLEVVPDTKRRLSGPLIEIKENKILETNGNEDETEGASSEEPAVQWDEGNFVDPNLLGGAIEAFLKGMGSAPGPSTSEKRVSFKKS